jgi:hypothetical protein
MRMVLTQKTNMGIQARLHIKANSASRRPFSIAKERALSSFLTVIIFPSLCAGTDPYGGPLVAGVPIGHEIGINSMARSIVFIAWRQVSWPLLRAYPTAMLVVGLPDMCPLNKLLAKRSRSSLYLAENVYVDTGDPKIKPLAPPILGSNSLAI